MIDNQYIYELDINLDLDYIAQLVKKTQYSRIPGIPRHHRRVVEDPYLTSVLTKYPFLNPIYNVYSTQPLNNIEVHVDAKRQCALNVPIENTEGSHTIFYEYNSTPDLTYDDKRVYYKISSPVTETFRFTLTRPVLINNTVPHSVEHTGPNTRLILSWGIRQDVSFEDAKRLINEKK